MTDRTQYEPEGEPPGIPVEFRRNRIRGTGGSFFVPSAQSSISSSLFFTDAQALRLGIKLPEPGKTVKGRLIFLEDDPCA